MAKKDKKVESNVKVRETPPPPKPPLTIADTELEKLTKPRGR